MDIAFIICYAVAIVSGLLGLRHDRKARSTDELKRIAHAVKVTGMGVKN